MSKSHGLLDKQLTALTPCLDGTCCAHRWHLEVGYRADVVNFCIHHPALGGPGATAVSLMEPEMRELYRVIGERLALLDAPNRSRVRRTGMRLYVAGSFRDIPAVQTLMAQLVMEGHTISHDWTQKEAQALGYREGTPEMQAFLLECGREDLEGVRSAEGLVLVGHELCRDAMAEFGMALGLSLPCWVLYPERRRSVFYGCRNVFLAHDVPELLRSLAQWRARIV